MPRGGRRSTTWKPGEVRSRKGSWNVARKDVREAARKLVEDPEYRRALKRRILDGTAGNMEVLLWHYAYGKPKETIAVDPETTETVASLMLRFARRAAESRENDG